MPKVAVRGDHELFSATEHASPVEKFWHAERLSRVLVKIKIRAATCEFLAATAKQPPEKPSSSGLVVAQVPKILLSIG